MNLEIAQPSNHASVHLFEGYRLEAARRSLTCADGSAVSLTGKPFDVLVYLLRHAGEVVDRDELLQAVWPRRVVEENNINQAVALLRRVIGRHHIATVPGRGYQFVTPVQEIAGELATPSDAARGTATEPNELVFPLDIPLNVARGLAPASAPRESPKLAAAPLAVAATVAALAAGALLYEPQQAAPDASIGAIASVAQLTTYPGEEVTPAFSPDGTQVAFSWDGGAGNEDIYVTQIGTRAIARLTTSAVGADRYPAWSPNGQYIAFLRQLDVTRFDLIVIPSLGGGQEQTLYSGELDWISREGFPLLAWTPDSAQIWFTTRNRDSTEQLHYGLHRASVATRAVEEVELRGTAGDYVTSPAFSPDGRWLAFTRFRSGERLNRVMVTRLGAGFAPTGDTQVVAEAALHHSLAWAPSGNRLWFVQGGTISEWRVGGSLRIAATIGPQPLLGAVAFTHDGLRARAAVVSRYTDADIFVLPLDPVTHAAMGPAQARLQSTATDYHPRFSPDGQKLAFVSDRSGHRALWIANADGSEPRQITELRELITGFPRWSPDAARLAFHTSAPNEERVIYTVSAIGGPPKRLGNACCPGGWAGDGEHVYVHDVVGVNRLLRMNVYDGSTEPLFEGELGDESADGRYLLYSKSRERGYFRRLLHPSSGMSDEEKLVSDYVPPTGGLAAVADGFFYLGLAADDRPRAFRFYDYALGKARDIAPAPPSVAIGLTASLERGELLYAADSAGPNADLTLLEFDSAPADRLTPSRPAAE